VGAASASAERRKPRFIGEVFLFGTAMNLSRGGRGVATRRAGKTGEGAPSIPELQGWLPPKATLKPKARATVLFPIPRIGTHAP
jgi:hypothetical protein